MLSVVKLYVVMLSVTELLNHRSGRYITQPNDTWNNDTMQNNKNATFNIAMCCIIKLRGILLSVLMLSVIMPSVNMLNVVAPRPQHCQNGIIFNKDE